MIKRHLSAKILKLSRQFPVISLNGPRQSGKTTLVKKIFPDYSYINLENIDSRIAMEEDPRGILESHKDTGLIIDEAQKVPHLFSYLQGIVDDSKKMGKFVLTGSQNYLLMEKITQSLAGRVAIYNLYPFGLQEINKTKFKKKSLNEYLFTGFYPPIYDRGISPEDFYPLYIQTYIERDIRTITNVSKLNIFQKFVRLCAGRNGQLLNMTGIGNDCGIDQKTVRSWISILEASYIIYLLQPHHENFNKRLVKQPKLYFYDTGLLCSLLGIENHNQLETHHMRGAIFEAFIISEYIKHRSHNGLNANSFFWRDNTGHEIDLLIQKGNDRVCVEIKSSRTFNEEFFNGLNFYHKISNNKTEDNFVVYAGNANYKRSMGNIVSWKNFLNNW